MTKPKGLLLAGLVSSISKVQSGKACTSRPRGPAPRESSSDSMLSFFWSALKQRYQQLNQEIDILNMVLQQNQEITYAVAKKICLYRDFITHNITDLDAKLIGSGNSPKIVECSNFLFGDCRLWTEDALRNWAKGDSWWQRATQQLWNTRFLIYINIHK